MEVTRQTIYTFNDFEEAKAFRNTKPGALFSSPNFKVYQVIVETCLCGKEYKVNADGGKYCSDCNTN